MKLLFSVPGENIWMADKERMIFRTAGGNYYDINGNAVPAEAEWEGLSCPQHDNPWDSDWVEYEGLDEPLVSESTVEVDWEIDDGFGNFGFKNRAGEFIIEPQYAFAYEFTCGLAAVNLNRTWYRLTNGQRVYENHFGYINGRGETVIPFMYDEARPFNKYGVAVVEDRKKRYLIDTNGNVIPGTELLHPTDLYDYSDRFLQFVYDSKNWELDGPVGLYDTKERRIILEPSADDTIEWEEDLICIYERSGAFGGSDFRQHYINSKGEKLFPWLLDKGFAIVERPSKYLVSVVAIAEYTEISGNSGSYISHEGKKYERTYRYGLYSSGERFILQPMYELITELSDNIYGCVRDGVVSVMQLDDYNWGSNHTLHLAWHYCVVGNVVKSHIDENGILRYGTSTFSGGTKVYLCKNGSPEEDEVSVVGLDRGKRYRFIRMKKSLIENVRCSRAFKPSVLDHMGDPEQWNCWWGRTKEDKADTERFVREWNDR